MSAKAFKTSEFERRNMCFGFGTCHTKKLIENDDV